MYKYNFITMKKIAAIKILKIFTIDMFAQFRISNFFTLMNSKNVCFFKINVPIQKLLRIFEISMQF